MLLIALVAMQRWSPCSAGFVHKTPFEEAYKTLKKKHARMTKRLRRAEEDVAALNQLVTDPLALGLMPSLASPHSVTGGHGAAHNGPTAGPTAASKASETLGNDDVTVRRSSIRGAGRGAFALRDFTAGETIGKYKCKVVPDHDVTADASRTWFVNGTHGCDGSKFPLRNPLLYANSVGAWPTCGRANAMTKPMKGSKGVKYVATRGIGAGDEILVNYGRDYFKTSERRISTVYECYMLPLNRAAARGDLAAVRALATTGTGLNQVSKDMMSTITHSLSSNLIRDDSVEDYPVDDGWTALMEASGGGHASVVQFLIDLGADATIADSSSGRTALLLASMNGHVDVVRALLRVAAIDANTPMSNGMTALGVACARGHYNVVQALLESVKVDYNALQKGGLAPLAVACQGGHADIVEALLDAPGVDVNAAQGDGLTALAVASQERHSDVVRMMLASGKVDANKAQHGGVTPLHSACHDGNIFVVEALLDEPSVDVNALQREHATPLHMASQAGHLDVVVMLLAIKAVRVNAAMRNGATPLLLAAQAGHTRIIQALLEVEGVDVNKGLGYGSRASVEALATGHGDGYGLHPMPEAVVHSGMTPLLAACMNGHADVVAMLIASPATPAVNLNHALGKHGAPLHIASDRGYAEVVFALVYAPSHLYLDVNGGVGETQSTALLLASNAGHTSAVEVLLRMVRSPTRKLNINQASTDGVTPLLAAVTNGHAGVVQLLLEAGADASDEANAGISLAAVADEQGDTPVAKYTAFATRHYLHYLFPSHISVYMRYVRFTCVFFRTNAVKYWKSCPNCWK